MAERGQQKKIIGVVVSNKMEKTVLVLVERLTKHKVYGKYIKRYKKYAAHDPNNNCSIGDKVQIIECRPLSKTKRWHILNILEKANI